MDMVTKSAKMPSYISLSPKMKKRLKITAAEREMPACKLVELSLKEYLRKS